jgi:hypothetical protein
MLHYLQIVSFLIEGILIRVFEIVQRTETLFPFHVHGCMYVHMHTNIRNIMVERTEM